MDMRACINLVCRLSEGRVFKVDTELDGEHDRTVTVVRNPSAPQIKTFLSNWKRARFCIVKEGGDLLIWNASEAIHQQIYDALALGAVVGGFIYDDEPPTIGMRNYDAEAISRVEPELRAYPSIQRAFGGAVRIESTDDDW